MELKINQKSIKQDISFKYLGVMMDWSLSWKDHVHRVSKKISRSIGILLKLRHFVDTRILVNIYYSIIYPFLTYGVMIWGNTYTSTIKPLITLHKKAIRVISFSNYQAHTSPLFFKLNILKVPDIVLFNTALFMYEYNQGTLPKVFDEMFTPVRSKHQYNTRLASKSSYCLPKIRTNYGKFGIRFQGPKIWNSLDESFKTLQKYSFKSKFKKYLINIYNNTD
jgi:hypothetical protein